MVGLEDIRRSDDSLGFAGCSVEEASSGGFLEAEGDLLALCACTGSPQKKTIFLSRFHDFITLTTKGLDYIPQLVIALCLDAGHLNEALLEKHGYQQ